MVRWKRQSSLAGVLSLLADASHFVLAQNDVDYVRTAMAFQAAVYSGVRHIILTSHMDLTALDLLEADPISSSNSTMIIKSSTKSIRGDCAGIPSRAGTTLDPPQTAIGQCIVTVAAPLLEIRNAATLLLSDVYIVLKREAPAASDPLLPLISIQTGSVWMTYSVLRGDRNNCRGVQVGRGQHFHSRTSDFVGFQADDSAAVRCEAGSRAGFKNCLFKTNAAKYHGSSVGLQSGNAGDIPAAAWFQSCIFSSNQENLGYPLSQSDSRASHYSNWAFQKSVDASTGNLIAPKPIVAEELHKHGFLVAQFSTFQDIADEQARLTNLAPVDIDQIPVDETEDGGGLSAAAIGGIVGGLLAVLLAIAAAVFIVHRKRKREQSSKLDARIDVHMSAADDADTEDSKGSAKAFSNRATVCLSSFTAKAVIPASASSHWTTDVDFVSTAFALSDGPPPCAAPAKRQLDYLHAQLSSIGTEAVVLERYTLLGPNDRRQGGQGIVAFARGVHDGLGYALKFFVDRPSFLAERAMYRSATLGTLLPQAHAEYDPEEEPAALLDRTGRPLPPCIAMERGEALPDWSKRARPDVFNAVAVIAHVAMRLRAMHEGGYVHRDIKPENLMLLPRANRWTVIDFGCAARAGKAAPLSYTLVYAPPEVAAAVVAAQANTIVADPAMDAWALGVVAFELLTGQSAFNLITEGRDSVLRKLLGQEELPWEGDLAEKNPAARRRLGLFREPVLALLRRDPAARATLADFCRTTNTVFSSPTTLAPTTMGQ